MTRTVGFFPQGFFLDRYIYCFCDEIFALSLSLGYDDSVILQAHYLILLLSCLVCPFTRLRVPDWVWCLRGQQQPYLNIEWAYHSTWVLVCVVCALDFIVVLVILGVLLCSLHIDSIWTCLTYSALRLHCFIRRCDSSSKYLVVWSLRRPFLARPLCVGFSMFPESLVFRLALASLMSLGRSSGRLSDNFETLGEFLLITFVPLASCVLRSLYGVFDLSYSVPPSSKGGID